jgi:hypothetical protein
VWAAGFVLAAEDWIGGQRLRVENWAYRDPETTRDDPHNPAVDLFWDRVQPWAPFRKGAGWRYRGRRGMAFAGVKGRRVPTQVDSAGRMVRGHDPSDYRVPTLDDLPLGPANYAATVLRGKFADAWGCPICSGFWGSLLPMLGLWAWGPFGVPLVVALIAHFAAWGAAREIGWRGLA